MKVVFFANFMPDPCGAFFHDVAIAKEFQRRGHTVCFVTMTRGRFPIRGVYRGIPWVFYTNAENEMKGANIWSSPHFPFLQVVRKLNEKFQKPLVVTMHFGEDIQGIMPYARAGKWAEFLWIVSNHITDNIKHRVTLSPTFKVVESMRPIMIEDEIKFRERGAPSTGDCITLINANMMKGLELFIELAKKFPHRKFLGVRPYYNKINVPENIPNIEWMDIQDDIRVVLQRTRILLVPSQYESWGRVAFEAMYNGIPVLHTKPMESTSPGCRSSGSTEGMCEWINDTQFMCEYKLFEDWVQAIEVLDDKETYEEYSKSAYDHTYAMNVFQDILEIEQKMQQYAIQYAPAIVDTKSQVATALTPGITQLRMPTTSASPFRGGRFAVRR